MQYLHGNRQHLLELLAQEREPRTATYGEELTFGWPEGQPKSGLPHVIYVADSDLRDFLAWVATYITSHAPLTSLCRVLPRSVQDLTHATARTEDLQGLASLTASLTIAETLSHAPQAWAGNIEHRHCASTLAFAMGRGLAFASHSSSSVARIADRWQTARAIAGQRQIDLPLEHLTRFWAILEGAYNSSPVTDPNIRDVCDAFSDILVRKKVDGHTLRRHLGVSDGIAANIDRRPREERVHLFEAIADAMRSSPFTPERRAFAIGLGAAAIAPGTLEHAALVRPMVPEFPTALMWYAACSSAGSSTFEWGRYTSIGRRVERDIQAIHNFDSRPQCDIAIDELEVIAPLLGPSITALASTPPYLRIELAPWVWTLTTIASSQTSAATATQHRPSTGAASTAQYDLFGDSRSEMTRPPAEGRASSNDPRIAEASSYLERAHRLLRDVSSGGRARGASRREREVRGGPLDDAQDATQSYAMVRAVLMNADRRDPRKVSCTCYVVYPGLGNPDEASPTELRLVVPNAADALVCTLQLLGRPTSTPGDPLFVGAYGGIAEYDGLIDATSGAMRGGDSGGAIYAHIAVRRPLGQAMLALGRSRVRLIESEFYVPIEGWHRIPDGPTKRIR